MLKAELECGIDRKVSEEEYDLINTVYMDYEGFADKEEVYRLYKLFGWNIFLDMYPRAKKAAELREKLRQAEKELHDLFKGGVKLYETQ